MHNGEPTKQQGQNSKPDGMEHPQQPWTTRFAELPADAEDHVPRQSDRLVQSAPAYQLTAEDEQRLRDIKKNIVKKTGIVPSLLGCHLQLAKEQGRYTPPPRSASVPAPRAGASAHVSQSVFRPCAFDLNAAGNHYDTPPQDSPVALAAAAPTAQQPRERVADEDGHDFSDSEDERYGDVSHCDLRWRQNSFRGFGQS